jgi:hypothetical protein
MEEINRKRHSNKTPAQVKASIFTDEHFESNENNEGTVCRECDKVVTSRNVERLLKHMINSCDDAKLSYELKSQAQGHLR